MRHLFTPRVEHLQALVVTRLISHRRRDMTFLPPSLVPRPVLGERQPEVEQGMIVARHIPYVHPYLTGVDFAPVATPLPLHPHRMRAPLGEAAGIEGDHPIGFTQPIDHLSN